MLKSEELFVLIIFVAALFPFIKLLLDSPLKGKIFLFFSYFFFLISNIFTQIEEIAFPETFNFLEHFSIFAGSLFILVFVINWGRKHHSEKGPKKYDN